MDALKALETSISNSSANVTDDWAKIDAMSCQALILHASIDCETDDADQKKWCADYDTSNENLLTFYNQLKSGVKIPITYVIIGGAIVIVLIVLIAYCFRDEEVKDN